MEKVKFFWILKACFRLPLCFTSPASCERAKGFDRRPKWVSNRFETRTGLSFLLVVSRNFVRFVDRKHIDFRATTLFRRFLCNLSYNDDNPTPITILCYSKTENLMREKGLSDNKAQELEKPSSRPHNAITLWLCSRYWLWGNEGFIFWKYLSPPYDVIDWKLSSRISHGW